MKKLLFGICLTVFAFGLNAQTTEYYVTFPIMSKISVRGDDMHPLYKWLTTKSENLVEDSSVR